VAPVVDNSLLGRRLDDALAAEDDPRRRRLLEVVAAHVRAETTEPGLDAVMATVAPDPQYHSYGSAAVDGAPKGRAAVEQFYRDFFAGHGEVTIQFDLARLAVGDDCVALDGTVKRLFAGDALAATGLDVDPGTFYLWETRIALFFSLDDDDRIIEEDTYPTGSITDGLVPVPIDDVPALLRAAASG
jgi:hypothetical protein